MASYAVNRAAVRHARDLIQAKRYQLVYTIETHTHADHLSGSPRLKDLTGAKMLMSANTPVSCVDRGLTDGDTIELGKLKIEVIATPGHTSDALCLVFDGGVLEFNVLNLVPFRRSLPK